MTKASSRGVLTPAHVIATPPASHPGPGFWLWLTEDQARAVESGLPILLAAARHDGRFAVEALERQLVAARAFFPDERSE